jgi:S-adenosylmethionine uptake transporter
VVGWVDNIYQRGEVIPFIRQQEPSDIALLLMLSTASALTQLTLTRAYRLGNVLLTANLQYVGIVFASILGILIWGDKLNWQAWCGIFIILISGLLATFYNQRSASHTTR